MFSLSRNHVDDYDIFGQQYNRKDIYPYLWHRFFAFQPDYFERLRTSDAIDEAFDQVNHRLAKREVNDISFENDGNTDTFTG